MKKHRYLFSGLLMVIFFSLPIVSEGKLKGTWCVGREGLVISFFGKDSLSVSSRRDETMQGLGRYEKRDSLLITTITNEDLKIEMGYRYKWKSDSLIRAKILYVSVNGDSINHPRRWLRMRLCDPDNFDFNDTTEVYDDEEAEEPSSKPEK